MKRYIMRKNIKVAEIDESNFVVSFTDKAPLLIMANKFETWEVGRETDVTRTNLRVIRRLLGLGARDTKQALIKINYASLFDTFWVKNSGSQLAWEDVRFGNNPLFYHALRGDDITANTPFKSPEHSNIGSYEKGWRFQQNRKWQLYKQGSIEEIWSEIFSTMLLRLYLGDMVVKYWKESEYVVCENFIDQEKDECLEHYHSIGENNTNEQYIIQQFKALELDYLLPNLHSMWYADALVQNPDRHEFNFGIIRSDKKPRFAPLYDFNLAMFAFRYPKTYMRYKDPLILTAKQLDLPKPFTIKEGDIVNVYKFITENYGLKIKATQNEVAQFVLSAQDLI